MSAVIDKSSGGFFDEDMILVERFLAGDHAAFESLYTKYYDKVFALARGVLLRQDEAQDAAQEVFTLVYRHLGRFNRQSKFSTWLFRIAVNRSIQEARRHRHNVRHVELSEAMHLEATNDGPIEDLDPKVQFALAGLVPADRALIIFFYWEEMSLSDIGTMLNCGVNAAKTRLYRARERFRVLYEKYEGGDI